MSLKSAIKARNISEIRRIVKEMPIADIADLLEKISSKERVIFFRLLKTEVQADIFASLEPEYQKQVISSFTDLQIGKLIDELHKDEIANLIEEMPKLISKRILSNVAKDKRDGVNKLLRYDSDQTGSIMTVDIITLKQSLTVSQARKLVRQEKDNAQLAHYFFVVNSRNRLVGHIAVEDLLFESRDRKIRDLARAVGSVKTTSNKEIAALEFAKQDMSVLPVINSKKEVVGMITSDDVIDVVQEGAADDIEKMAGVAESSTFAYAKASIWSIYRSRIFWLLLLLIPATLSHLVLEFFEGVSNDVLVPAALSSIIIATIPLFTDSAGNAGGQSSATVVRSLATGDITQKDYLKVLGKEVGVSILAGLTLAIINFARLLFIYYLRGELDEKIVVLSLAISFALFIVIVLSKVLGGMLPLLARAFNGDPAVMASPLLTTIIDTLSLIILFAISLGVMSVIF